jgi:hypothetical protein
MKTFKIIPDFKSDLKNLNFGVKKIQWIYRLGKSKTG